MSKDFAETETLSLPYLISSSASAGALASFLTSPLDLAKLRLQVQRGTNSPHGFEQYQGIIDCLQQAYQRGGVAGLFRGAGARVLHFVPATSKCKCPEQWEQEPQTSQDKDIQYGSV
jgi:hypothetical protein